MTNPAAFISYARRDDAAYGRRITGLRERLQRMVAAASGRDFEIFQDCEGIAWGQHWPTRLDEALEEALFLIPILTPSYFNSDACRAELETFLELERKSGRKDRVLSLYFLHAPVYEQKTDPLAAMLHERQHRDWRHLRIDPLGSAKVMRALDSLARELAAAIHTRQGGASPAAIARHAAEQTATPPQAPRREPGTIFRDVDAPWCPELVVASAGVFLMGSTEPERRWAVGQGAEQEWVDREKPQHRVAIPEPFAVGKYAITRGQFATFVAATAHDMSGGCWIWTGDKFEQSPTADWCAPGFVQTDDHPVVGVSWEDATAYVEWLGRETGQPYRLLSEAEWEYACRAGTTTRYAWGDEPPTPEQANFGGNKGGTTAVGTHPPNPWGFGDMHGNVLEWVEDFWNESYAGPGRPDDGSAWTSGDCSRRVLRGGSWVNDPESLRSAYRFRYSTGFRINSTGFRVARTLTH